MNKWAVAVIIATISIALLCPLAWYPDHALAQTRVDPLELTSVEVEVDIQDRLVVSRVDQILTNPAGHAVEGIVEFPLPPDAILTDLVLWLDDRPTEGLILDREQARRSYGFISDNGAAPARFTWGEEDGIHLRIFSIPFGESLRVELEYMQILMPENDALRYRFPAFSAPNNPQQIERLTLRAAVRAQQPLELWVSAPFGQIAEIQYPEENRAELLLADEKVPLDRNFELTILPRSGELAPVALSYTPPGGEADGYFALWIPPLKELTPDQPVLTVDKLTYSGAPVGQLFPSRIAALSADRELFQTGRYRGGGDMTVELTGRSGDQTLSYAFPLHLAPLEEIQIEGQSRELLSDDFDGTSNVIWQVSEDAEGDWQIDAAQSLLKISPPGYVARLYASVDDSSYVIVTRMRCGEPEGKVIFHQADRSEGWRLDLHPYGEARLTIGGILGDWIPIRECVWYDVRIEVADGVVNTFLNGEAVHRDVWMGGTVPDGKIGVGSWRGWAEFDYVRVFGLGEKEDRSTRHNPLVRLWAWQEIRELESQHELHPSSELLDHIRDLGLRHRLVTRMTSLFAPEEGIQIEDRLKHGSGGLAELSAASESSAVTTGAWRQPISPALHQNIPNPFNASTLIPWRLPDELAADGLSLVIFDLAGQRVRTFGPGEIHRGTNHITWNGRNDSGESVASGVYIYRLQGKRFTLSRKLLLLR